MFGLSAPQIEAREVKAALDKHADVVLLDVRTQNEFEREHIEGSIHVPLMEINTIERIIPDKEKTIYVYCLSGSRSDQAVLFMKERGYMNVFSIKSGLLAWRTLDK